MQPILSPTWEAPSPEKPALMWKSITDFPKPTLHLENSGRKFGTDEESAKRHQEIGSTLLSSTYDTSSTSHDQSKPRDMVYMAVVLTVLLYACESWIVCNRHA